MQTKRSLTEEAVERRHGQLEGLLAAAKLQRRSSGEALPTPFSR